MTNRPKPPPVWARPTRRTFVMMLGAAAAALAIKRPKPDSPKPAVATRLPRWIGHA